MSRIVHTIVIIINTRRVVGERDCRECAGISPIGVFRAFKADKRQRVQSDVGELYEIRGKKKPLHTCVVQILNVFHTNPLNKY